jgi:hypothetical protein
VNIDRRSLLKYAALMPFVSAPALIAACGEDMMENTRIHRG